MEYRRRARRLCLDARHEYLRPVQAGGTLYWFKFRKPKADTKGPADLDDYDFGEADDDTEYETEEDESDAPADSVDD